MPVPVTAASIGNRIYAADFSGSGQGIVEISGRGLLASPQSKYCPAGQSDLNTA
jgi:hypothetical protein